MLNILFAVFLLLLIYTIFPKYTNRKIYIINYGMILGFLILLGLAISVFMHSTITYQFFGYNLFQVSSLSSYFLIILAISGIAVSFYTNFYFKHYLAAGKKLNFYYAMLLLFIFSMVGVIMCNEAVSFLVFWELMSLSSYFLVIHEHEKPGVLNSGSRYFVITHIGMFFIVASFLPLILSSGSTIFSQRHNLALTPIAANLVFFAALVGFGSKAGLVPIHIWLPKAHPIAPSNVSALMSGFMIKLPVLLLLKYFLQFLPEYTALSRGIIVLFIGGISAFIGIFFALRQYDIKRLLAYSSIENIGIIFVGLGMMLLGTYFHDTILIFLGIFACLYHTFNHSIIKTLLFLVAGSIIERTHRAEYNKLGGLIKKLPFLAFAFLIAALAIAGLPPLNGFNSELTAFVGIIHGIASSSMLSVNIVYVFVLLLLGAMSALALVCFTKVFSITFLGNPREDIHVDKKSSINENIGYGILLLSIIALAFFPGGMLNIISQILGLPGGDNVFALHIANINYIPIGIFAGLASVFVIGWYIYRRALKKSQVVDVRNCGYPDLIAKSQYPALSLIQPIRRLYKGLYLEISNKNHVKKEEGKEYYKKNISHIDYKVQENNFIGHLYDRLIGACRWIHQKLINLQDGSLQHYIGYMLIALLLLILIYTFTF